ncbi:hypothetical protein D9756_001594 [Leucocoprinus leucothites]|uniref:Uncharacterized protein n=1 Tax=Leucocoprinus leucothites TaxID=201217 RepID=A0A8H5G3V8_9AGAR|nr:hypothetical protein D9756_001594 [Leucoagaricus leucothites]
MFRPGLLDYVSSTTLPHIPESADMPVMPLPGHRSNRNHLTVRSEEWRRLETIYQIDPPGLARQVNDWTALNIRNVSFEYEDAHSTEKLSLGTRRRGGNFDCLGHPIDTIDRLGAFLDILPLRTAQRLFHILHPDTRQWKFKHHDEYDVDHKIFDYFLWTKTQRGTQEAQSRLVVAYQPPWILSQTDFEEFVRCGSLPPHIPPGHLYPADLHSRHKVWAKLWDTCVKHNTKWFVVTSWNVWAFGCFSDGWCSGAISDIWHLDEHTPNILECLTYWIASAMSRPGAYQRPKVPEPLNALRTVIILPATQVEIATPAVSESNWRGKSQDAATSAHLTSLPISLSHQGVEEDYTASPIRRNLPRPADFILEWRDSVVDDEEESWPTRERATVLNRELQAANLHGEWLI